jgi:hypothetical protein
VIAGYVGNLRVFHSAMNIYIYIYIQNIKKQEELRMKVRGGNTSEDAGLMSLDTDAKNLGHQLRW